MKQVVISGINIFEGVPLTIYKEFLDVIIKSEFYEIYGFTAFVHKKSLFCEYENYFEIIELPKSRDSYFLRMYYEYVYFYKFSQKREIFIWISLHDITPNVKAEYQYVYCHNPTPFLKLDFHLCRMDRTIALMAVLYRYVYRFNIKKNKTVIVQQQWLKQEFQKMFHINNILVIRPEKNINDIWNHGKRKEMPYTFLVVSYPRPFKNFEIVCDACKIIKTSEKYQILFTISGNENKYAKYLYKKYHNLPQIIWMGLQNKKTIYDCYSWVDCLIFPSKLETWGLPISEFAASKKPMLLADLPYAHETVGNYQKVNFFHPDNAEDLATLMRDSIEDKLNYKGNELKNVGNNLYGWSDLLDILLKDKNNGN